MAVSLVAQNPIFCNLSAWAEADKTYLLTEFDIRFASQNPEHLKLLSLSFYLLS